MASANKHVLMAAITCNIKRLLKFSRPKLLSPKMTIPKIKVGKELSSSFFSFATIEFAYNIAMVILSL